MRCYRGRGRSIIRVCVVYFVIEVGQGKLCVVRHRWVCG